MASASLTFRMRVGRGDGFAPSSILWGAKSRHDLAGEMVLDMLDEKEAFGTEWFAEADGTRGVTVWAPPAERAAAVAEVLAAASALGVDAGEVAQAAGDAAAASDDNGDGAREEAPGAAPSPDAGLRARVAGTLRRALRRQAATCRVRFEGRDELVAFGIDEDWFRPRRRPAAPPRAARLARPADGRPRAGARDAARESRAPLLGGHAALPLVACADLAVDSVSFEEARDARGWCRVAATAEIVVLRPGRAPLARLDGVVALLRREARTRGRSAARQAALGRLSGSALASLEPGDALHRRRRPHV